MTFPENKKYPIDTAVPTVLNEKALIESDQRYRALVELTLEAIVIHAGGKILFANPSAVTMFGAADVDDLIGRQIIDLVHKDDREHVLMRAKRSIETGVRSEKAELRYHKLDGTPIVAEVQGSPIRYDGKSAVQVSMHDVTHRKQTEELLARQNGTLSKLNQFSIDVTKLSTAHELEALITTWIKDIAGAEMALFSGYDADSRTLSPQHIEVEPGLLERGVMLLGHQWKKVRSVVDDEMYGKITHDIIGSRKSLHEVSFGAIPRPVAAAIQALFRVDRFIGVVYLIEGNLYGTSVLGMSKDKPDPPRQILENFLHLAAASLRRKTMEQQLMESEQRFRSLYENSTIGLYRTTPGGDVVLANPTLVKMLGYASIEELAARNLSTVYFAPANDRKQFLERMETFGEIQNLESAWTRKDGSILYVSESARVLRDAQGTIVYYDGTVEDITERKQMHTLLHDTEARQGAMIANIADTLAIIAADGTFMYHSENVEKIFGWRSIDLVGRAFSETIHPDDKDRVLKAFALFLKKENTSATIEFRYIVKDGSYRLVELTGMNLLHDKIINGVLVNYHDITERKRLEQQLIQSQKMEGVGTLAGGIAHDFNNLLAMILGSAELLRHHTEENPELVKYVDRIIDASERGSSISRQLLIFSRPDQVELKPISLSQIIADIKVLLKHFLPKTIAIETSMEIDHGIIMGDAGQIHQALLNLALNARDAMSDTGTLTIKEFTVTPEVIGKKFGRDRTGPFIGLSVGDTGSGMDDAVVQKIFDPFFSTKEKGKGTGLGLSMVHAIVRNHEGYIDVDTALGRGTTISLYFPAVAHMEERDHRDAPELSAPRAGTILVVDDEDPLREMLSEYLDGKGYNVHSAANGTEALASFQQHGDTIDLVITDLGMPDMRGEELYRRLKKLYADVKVIVSSGYLDGITKEHLLTMGVKGVLTKPYRLSTIGDEIQKVMSD